MYDLISSFKKRYYNYLLFIFIVLFITRPFLNQGIIYISVWKLCLTCAFLSAVFTVKHHTLVRKVTLILAGVSALCNCLELYFTSVGFYEASLTIAIAFMGICTVSVVYNVILRARVTLETLRGVVCAYFMMALVFAHVYFLIEYLIPGSFALSDKEIVFGKGSSYLSQLMYFSFITLLTIGFGDIVPLLGLSQTAVVIEGIIGQFYIAILVSRIVAVYSLGNKLMKVTKDRAKRRD